ncbi:WSC domain-containing protein ARB_07867 {ECO:0000305} Flags: Precursor [Serendipita indica DSM 11827]|nr:WSC domain-containing protein ARB_07867 {ECO:0000305} Flags: Precursor [Serendipita indica DSM 11827]
MKLVLATSGLLLTVLSTNALIFELPSHSLKRSAHRRGLTHKAKRAPTLPATWSYYGCVTDGAQRTLGAAGFESDTMTVEACVDFCDQRNYRYAGLEYSKECFCDNTFQNGATTAAASDCNMICSGDGTEVCGGGYRLSTYASSKGPPGPLLSYNDYGYQGCYTDSAAMRSLPVPMGYAGSLTPEKCIDACSSEGYVFAGLEYAAECYCGNVNGGALADASGCNMPCAGDGSHICGGGNRLTLYQAGTPPVSLPTTSSTSTQVQTSTSTSTSTVVSTSSSATTSSTGVSSSAGPGWNYLACYTDSVAQRTLNIPMGVPDLTIEKCQDACKAANYVFAGVEYGAECYCSNTILATATAAVPGACSMPCAGDAAEICGGGNAINIYQYGGTSTPPPPGPSVLPSYSGWSAQGCYIDSVADRSLPVPLAVPGGPAAMTVQLCLDAAYAAGYTYAGIEYASECWVGNTITVAQATDDRCNMLCNGNQMQICGGPNGLTLYHYDGVQSTVSSTSTEEPTSTSSTVVSTSTSSSTEESTSTSTSSSTESSSSSTETTETSTSTSTESTSTSTDSTSTSTSTESTSTSTSSSTEEPTSTSTSTESTSTSTSTDSTSTSTSSSTEESTSTSTSAESTSTSTESTSTSTESTSSSTSTDSTSTSTSSSTEESTSTSTSTSTTVSATPTGPSFLQTYGNWQSQGCWSDNAAARSLPYAANLNGITTPQRCMDACYNAGYSYAGLEYAAECYCGNAVGGALADDSGCNMLCQSDSLHYCGGPDRLNLYKYNGVVPPPTNPPPGGGGGGGVPPLTTGLPGTWTYNGCWVDNAYGRIFGFVQPASQSNSALSCIAQCSAAGYSIAGTQYSQECWCGNHMQNAAVKAASDADCNMACAGDPDHACGGPNRLTVYAATPTFPVYPVPTIKTTGLPGSYEYHGCFAEAPGGLRLFEHIIESQTATTVEGCLNLCSSYGYPAASLEFGTQCFCGDVEQITTAQAPDADCNIPCSGSPTDYCGGVGKLNIYTWNMTPNPLFVWNTPANTGRYEFLIGGVVIPLIATLGLNNKVTFLEKYGTGAPNSTGAYELDLSITNDFAHAWREMHVSSDVFCAANIVLPDRKGRVISVGGWSLDSTKGVRLYTPSGSPGVNGTTDWIEEFDLIHLQDQRWYPSALVMANGSILVIGGEEGSNGKPRPTLEILPKPEGGPTLLTMDWLLRTDPNNLYPFVYVLPTGGIFVIYYNEGRILDEVTFATTKTFPIAPGAVSVQGGGRTYPMEGSSVALPQYPPYTAPLEILTAGSAFGLALDNCVSIEPEGAGEWVIERMPGGKRVMPIMAPLPDGTYLIMGGAKNGVAGFGLANTPNLQAILYDPSKPRNQRFSILGQTIVARLYHSEATLLPDGRVLVSGSDPEDNLNPQEYRMEVYVPPYLTDGRIPPTYTIVERDWEYSGTYQITVNLPQGPISNLRISLLGAMSTTHGNTFGTRTIFPEFSCTGNVCTIVAPPNSHVCPPGWFQLFVLDGPTPSHSQWVRIGGDPANLASWPPFPEFNAPGPGTIYE